MEIFYNEIMWQILKKGIYIGGKKYMLFSATTGQVRNDTITLIRKDFYEKHKGYLMAGLSQERINTHTNAWKKEKGMNVGKYLSYNALPLSSSILTNIENEHTDGAGMFLPGELHSSCQIRGDILRVPYSHLISGCSLTKWHITLSLLMHGVTE